MLDYEQYVSLTGGSVRYVNISDDAGDEDVNYNGTALYYNCWMMSILKLQYVF